MEKFVAKVLAGLPVGATPSLVVKEFAKALASEVEAFKAEEFFKAAGAPYLAAAAKA